MKRRSEVSFKKSEIFPTSSSRQSGQALTEYVLLIVVLSAFSFSIFRTFQTQLKRGYGILGAELERSLQTGNFPEATTMWNN